MTWKVPNEAERVLVCGASRVPGPQVPKRPMLLCRNSVSRGVVVHGDRSAGETPAYAGDAVGVLLIDGTITRQGAGRIRGGGRIKSVPITKSSPASTGCACSTAPNGSFYRLSFSPEARVTSEALPFFQIGTEQGLLSAAVEMDVLILGPGERADLLVDFRTHAGKQVILRLPGA